MIKKYFEEEVAKTTKEYGNVINILNFDEGTATFINDAVVKMLITTFQFAQAGGTLTQFDGIISGNSNQKTFKYN